VGCSSVLDWDDTRCDIPDEQRRPCLNQQCSENFSCRVNVCIPDGCLERGDTCYKDRQCSTGLYCAPGLFACTTECEAEAFYLASTKCETGEYCQPLCSAACDPSGVAARQWVGACVTSECNGDNDCAANQTCATASDSAGACVDRCQVAWVGSDYLDSCRRSADAESFCQPIGRDGQQVLACVSTSTAAVAEGLSCINPETGLPDPIGKPCRPPYALDLPDGSQRDVGLICAPNGRCHEYCNPDLPDACAGTCCPLQLAPKVLDRVGYCAPSGVACVF